MLLAAPVFSQSGNAPSNLSVTLENGDATLTWDAPTTDVGSVTLYEIAATARADGANRTHSFTLRTRNAPTSWTFGLRSRRIRYYTFKVRAMRNGVGSAWSNAVTIDSGTSAPANLRASAGNASVTLAWDNPNDAKVTGYQYRYVDDVTAPIDWADVAWHNIPKKTSHPVTGLANGTRYTFQVRAKNAFGPGASSSVTGTPTAPFTPVDPPAAPGNLRAAVGDRSVTLSWDDPIDAKVTGYQYRYVDDVTAPIDWDDVTWQDIAKKASHPVTGLTNGTSYTFEVRAKRGSVAGASSSVTATPTAPPAAPSNLTATPGDESMNLSWNNPNDASITGYQYRYKTGTDWDPDWTDIRNSGTLTTSHLLTGLTNGTEHTFEVRAKNAGGDGASASVTGTPVAPPVVNPPVVPGPLSINSFEQIDGLGNAVTISNDTITVERDVPIPTVEVTASGGKSPYTFSLSGNIPNGPEAGGSGSGDYPIRIDQNSGSNVGRITGTPIEEGDFGITVNVEDSVDSTASRVLTMSVFAPSLQIESFTKIPDDGNPSVIRTDTIDVNFDEPIPQILVNARGGVSPYTFSLIEGSDPVPDGIVVNSTTGQITGTPKVYGYFTFTVKVVDHVAKSTMRDLTMHIIPPPLSVSPIGAKTAWKDSTIIPVQIDVSGGYRPYTFSISGEPSGLSVNDASGAITGAPLSAGRFAVRVAVTDDNTTVASTIFTLNVGSNRLAEKFSPVLIMANDRRDPTHRVIFPEPVEIVGANSVHNVNFVSYTVTGSKLEAGSGSYRELTPEWRTHFDNVVYPESELSDNEFTSISMLTRYVAKPPNSATGKHFVSAWYDYPGESPSDWYEAYDGSGMHAGATHPNTAYVHFFENSNGHIVIKYYYFYPFNHWVNTHEGDWPNVTVLVTSTDPDQARLIGVDYNFHGKGIGYDSIGGRIFNPRTHFAPAQGGSNSVVYVGAGSHGSYPTSGTYSGAGGAGTDESLLGTGLVLSTSVRDATVPSIAQPYNLVLLPDPDPSQPNMGLAPKLSWLGSSALFGTPVADRPWYSFLVAVLEPIIRLLSLFTYAQIYGSLDGFNFEVDETIGSVAAVGPRFHGWYDFGATGFDTTNVPFVEFQHFPILHNVTWRDTVDLIGDIVVYPDARLTIEPGTVVRADAGDIHLINDVRRVEIVNYGELNAGIVEGDSVVFSFSPFIPPSMTQVNLSGGWYGIRNHGRLTLRNCVIRDALIGLSGDGTDLLYNTRFVDNLLRIEVAPVDDISGISNVAVAPVQINASGGEPPYAYLLSGAPTGITISESGLVSGISTQVGDFTVNVTVLDTVYGTGNGNFNPMSELGTASVPISATRTFTMRVRSSSTVPPPALGAVTGLSATKGNGQVALRWTNPNGATKNQLRYAPTGTSLPATWTEIDATTSRTVRGLTNCTEYTFEVRAKNNRVTGGSASVNATPGSAPGAVTGLRATKGNGQVTLRWTNPSGTTKNQYRYAATGTSLPATWTEINATTRLPLTGLTDCTEYTFEVRAKNGCGTGGSANIKATPGSAPGAVSGLSATTGNGQVTLRWTNPSGTIKNQYRYAATGTSLPATWTEINATTSRTVTGLANCTEYTFEVRAKNGCGIGGSVSAKGTPKPPCPTIAVKTPFLVGGCTGKPISTGQVTVSGGQSPYKFSLDGAPSGISISSSGLISGTSTQVGIYQDVGVNVTDNCGCSGTGSLHIIILSPNITINAISDKEATQNSAISNIQVGVSTGCPPYRYSLSGAPSGVSISSSGLISGTPTEAGSFKMTVTVSDADSANSDTESFTLRVRALLSIAYIWDVSGTKGVAIRAIGARASGGVPPYKYSISGAPSGISIGSTSGSITGTPTTIGSFNVTVTVTDAKKTTAERSFTMRVSAPLTIQAIGDKFAVVKDFIIPIVVDVSGGRKPYTYSLSGAPPGVSFSNSVIDGTPTKRGTFTLTLTAKDADNRRATVTFKMTVGWPGDYNNDGRSDASDAKMFREKLGSNSTDSRFDPRMDLNRDGIINFADLVILSGYIESDASSQSKSESGDD